MASPGGSSSSGGGGVFTWDSEKPEPLLPTSTATDSGGSSSSNSPNIASTLDRLRNITPRNLAYTTLDFLTPEILRRKSGPRRPLSSTAWLDGLRGWAAFTVCLVHMTVYTHSDIESCYHHAIGLGADGQMRYNDTPAAWPFLRIFFSGGHIAVMVFFVISGYVITRKPLSLLHEGAARRDDFLEALNSSMVRRPLRLFLPVMSSTLFLACAWHVFGLSIPWPELQSNLFYEFVAWLSETSQFVYFYRNGYLFTRYNPHTWTIPVELRGSMFLFVWLFVLHQVPSRARIYMTIGMMLYLVLGATGAWYACFFAGMLTAELDLLGGAAAAAAENSAAAAIRASLLWTAPLKALRRRRVLFGTLMHVMLVVGLFLAGQPSAEGKTKQEMYGECFGFRTLHRWIPPAYGDGDSGTRWYWLFWAAWMLLVAVKEINWVRRLFEYRFSQCKSSFFCFWLVLNRRAPVVLTVYPFSDLGRISFALYLLHGPLIGIFSEQLFYLTGVSTPIFPSQWDRVGHLVNKWHDASWWPLPDGGPAGFEPNFLFCVLLSLPLFMYMAELGTKMFDMPSVSMSAGFYKKLRALR